MSTSPSWTWFALLLCLGACSGRREPPLSAGPGVLISSGQSETTIGLDPKQVPVVAGCAKDQVVVATRDGFACTAAAPLAEAQAGARILAAEQRLRALSARQEDLNAGISSLVDRLRAAQDATRAVLDRPIGIAAAACARSEATLLAGSSTVVGGMVMHRGNSLADVVLDCPLIGTSSASHATRLRVRLSDPDGAGAESEIQARLLAIGGPQGLETLLDLSSSALATDREAMEAELPRPLRPATEAYYVELRLHRARLGLAPLLVGVELRTP
ncbi:MAG: hypothetical protein U1E65_01700 [Myxococcota bacterium]